MVDLDIAMLVLRVAVGAIFAAHGLQKLLGWCGGPGWEGWKGFIAYLGPRPDPLLGVDLAGCGVGGGIALILGLLMPLAAAGLVAQTIVLLVRVHWPNGFWTAAGGIEFPLALGAGAFAVQLLGPGAWASDMVLPVDVLYEPSVRWSILVVAVAGALVAIFWRASTPPAEAAERIGANRGCYDRSSGGVGDIRPSRAAGSRRLVPVTTWRHIVRNSAELSACPPLPSSG